MKTIRELRQDKQMTLAEIGQAIGVRPQAVHQWEQGMRTPNVRRLRELARLFGVPMDAITLPALSGRDDDARTAAGAGHMATDDR